MGKRTLDSPTQKYCQIIHKIPIHLHSLSNFFSTRSQYNKGLTLTNTYNTYTCVKFGIISK